jgi:GNAT superfamily N-acetyltransferase
MIKLRHAVPDDAPQIVEMAGLLCLHEGKPLPRLSIEEFVRDGFGPQAAFFTVVAEEDGKLLGYVAFYPGYDLETAGRGLHIADLFVHSPHRGRGVGKMLMAAVAKHCKHDGGSWVQWFCQKTNRLGLDFYTSLGPALEDDAVSFCLQGARLDALVAAE